VSELVQVGIETMTVLSAEAMVGALKPEDLIRLRDGLGGLPEDRSMSDALRREGRIMADWFQKQERFPNDLFMDLSSHSKRNLSPAQQRQWSDEAQRREWTEAFVRYHDDAAEANALPPEQRQEAMRQIISRLQQGEYGLLSSSIAPSVDRAFE